jgi:hypothetical protein
MCVSCDNPATDWACVRNKTAEDIVHGDRVKYSKNLEDYDPMCSPCHQALDHKGEAHGQSKLTEAIVIDLRERHARGEHLNYKALGSLYGVTRGTVYNAVTGRKWKYLNK